MTPEVAVVVVSFHRPKPLHRLLSLAGDPRIELIVVNIEADEEVSSLIGEFAATEVAVDGNPGFAAGVNAGVAVAAAPVVIFANDDVEFAASDALRLADAVTTRQVSVVCPKLVDRNGIEERTIQALPSVGALLCECLLLPDKPVVWLDGHINVQKWRLPVVPETVKAVTGALVAARRDLLAREPLPTQYFLYWEESEWFWRLSQRGEIVEYCPEVVARHAGGRHDVRPDKSALIARNAVRCIRRTQGRSKAFMAWPVVVFWQARLVLADGIRLVLGRGSARRLRARGAGLRAALRAWREIR